MIVWYLSGIKLRIPVAVRSFFIVALILASTVLLGAQTVSLDYLNNLATRTINEFNVPGLAIAIVKDGKVLYARGYGVRSILSSQKVDEHTKFGIASNSKAFTTAALGRLVSEGKINWMDKVTQYIPEFRMYDDCVTADFRIIDLLSHRSGLGYNAGDLLHAPDSTDFTIQDVIHSLHFLKPAAPFRTKFAYDNILYLVAGELIARVTGMNWGDYIEKQILAPLQMTNSNSFFGRVKPGANVILGHRIVHDKLETVTSTISEADAGAGGIYSCASDMAQWMLLNLNRGKYGVDLKQELLTPQVHNEIWTPQIMIPVGRGNYNAHFGAYGLGWFLVEVKGNLQVFHSGQDFGMVSEVSMIPDLGLGITVLANREEGQALRAVIDQLTDIYLGMSGTDRVREYSDRQKQKKQSLDTVTENVRRKIAMNQNNNLGDDHAFAGTYHDNWFGDVMIFSENGKWRFKSKRSPQLQGQMFPYEQNTFVVRWDKPEIPADAFVFFLLDESGKSIKMSMRRVSPMSPSYLDFQDLDFSKVK